MSDRDQKGIEYEVVDEEEEEDLVYDLVFGPEPKAQEIKDQLVGWLEEELDDLRPSEGESGGNERYEMEQTWQTWRRMSMARPRHDQVTKPWKGAANMATPFMFSNINGVTSHVKSAITEKRPRLTMESMDSNWSEHAKAFGAWVNRLVESPLHINLPRYDTEIPYETTRMGTQVIETSWVQRRSQIKRMVGSAPEVIDKIVYEGPDVQTYRLEDVFIRNEFATPEDTPVIFLRSYYTQQDLKVAEQRGEFENIDAVLSSPIREMDGNKRAENDTLGLDSELASNPTASQLYEVLKTYVRFDADQDGIPEDLIVWWNPSSRTILKSEFNELGVRPICVSKYISIPKQFYALGVGWMLEPIQAEIDTLHNIRINSLHIASLQMFATRPGSDAIGPDEEFYPFKRVVMEEPDDFKVIEFPDTSAGTFQAEMMDQQYGRTVTGIAEAQLGMPDTTAKSGTSPTLQQFLSEQGNKVLRSIIKNAEMAQSQMGMHIVLTLVANGSLVIRSGKLLELAEPNERPLIEEVLMMSVEDVPLTFQFTVKSTPADETQDAKRQMVLTKMQLYMQYFQTAMQIQEMLASPQLPQELREFMQKMFVGMTNITEETLKLYDVDNIDELLPNVKHQELMLEMLEQMRKPQVEQMEQTLRRMKDGRQMGAAGPGMESYAPGYTRAVGTEREPGVGGPQGVPGGPARGGTASAGSSGPGNPGAASGGVPGAGPARA